MLALVLLGYLKALFMDFNKFKSIIETVIVGGMAAATSYGIGALVKYVIEPRAWFKFYFYIYLILLSF